MHNPFAKPHSPEEWVLSSVCWTLICLICWLSAAIFIARIDISYEDKKHLPTWLLVSFIVPYALACVKAWPAAAAFSSRSVFVNVAVILWTVSFFIVLIGWLLAALFTIALSEPSTGLGF